MADLWQQCKATGVPFEILCFDDGSEAHFKEKNRQINQAEIRYHEMPRNLGRSAIRNALGRAAQYHYFLFMDCDSKVVKTDFIKTYILHLSPDTLLYGGRSYSMQKPVNEALNLHWKYGAQREQTTAHQRRANPWGSFMTNNFLVPKSIFLENTFDETLRQYGHEDTLFGLQLAAKNIRILHLDNPLEHIGLETATHFLQKTEQGIQNLHALWQRGTSIDTKLLRYFQKIKKYKAVGLMAPAFVFSKSWLIKHLTGSQPILLFFDLYKLGYLCFLENNQHKPLSKNEL